MWLWDCPSILDKTRGVPDGCCMRSRIPLSEHHVSPSLREWCPCSSRSRLIHELLSCVDTGLVLWPVVLWRENLHCTNIIYHIPQVEIQSRHMLETAEWRLTYNLAITVLLNLKLILKYESEHENDTYSDLCVSCYSISVWRRSNQLF